MTKRRIAVATDGLGGLDEQVSGHFGRCLAFTVVTVEDGDMQVTQVARNPFATEHRPGVVPKLVRELDVDGVIAGGMGPRAAQVFERFGIQVGLAAHTTVREAVSALVEGTLGAPAGDGAGHHHHHAHHGEHEHGHAHHGSGCGGGGGCGGHGHGHGHGHA